MNSQVNYSQTVVEALSFHQECEYEKAKLLYVKALEENPYDAQALQLLGTILYLENEKISAIVLMKNSLAIDPTIYDTHNNLANIYKADKNYDLALEHYKIAMEINPKNALTYNNIAIVYKEQKKYDLAIESYKQAFNYDENYTESYANLANLYFEILEYNKAIEYYKKAIEHNMKFQKAYTMLSGIFQILDTIPDALIVLEEYIKYNNADEVYTLLAIYIWIDGDIKKCINYLQKIQINNFDEDNTLDRFIVAYKSFLMALIAFREDNNTLFTSDDSLEKLYVIGDSHSLSYSNLKVTYENRTYRVVSKIIIGAKAWHFSDIKENRYKVQLKNIISNLEKNSKVLILFGEIDCRLDDGILQNYKKRPSDLKKTISIFVEKYIKNTLEICHQKMIEPLYSTVPAPIFDSETDKIKRLELVSVIEIFNESIRQVVPQNQIYDTFSITSNNVKESNKKFHIDRWHLSPEVMMALMKNKKG